MVCEILLGLWKNKINEVHLEFDYMFEVIQTYNKNKKWVYLKN